MALQCPLDRELRQYHLQVFIRFIFALLPFLCSSISLLIKSTFPIRTKEMLDQIHEGIALHQR